MKKWKAILALTLVLALVLALAAGCAKTNTESGTATADNAADTSDAATPAQDTEDTEEADDEEEDIELTDVEFWFLEMGTSGSDNLERMNAAVNAITEPEGIHVNLSYFGMGDYMTKVPTALMGGDRSDLMAYSITSGIMTMVTNGLALDITDELNTYAPDAMALMEKYVGPYTFNGRIYGLPTMRALVTSTYLTFNKELIENAGLMEKVENLSSFSELEEVLSALYDAYAADGVYPFSSQLGSCLASNTYYLHGDKFEDIEVVDILGDTCKVVYTDSDGNVSNGKAKQEYVDACKIAQEWMDKGWLHPDGQYDLQWTGEEAMKNGVAAATRVDSEIGAEATISARDGLDVKCVKLYTGMIQTSTLTSWGIGVPITAEEPEAACKLINMLYTNADLMRVLVHGEEGVDYEVVDGEAVTYEGMYSGGNWIVGNNFLTIPPQGSGADLFELAAAENDAATCSPYLGFTIDTSTLDLVISQLSAVNDQYATFLGNGAYTDAAYQEYMAKLEDAGVQDYLDEVQTQLDAWLAEH